MLCVILEYPSPTISSVKKGSHFSLDDAQKRLSLGGKMVITQDLVAFTQVSSWERNRKGGKGEKNLLFKKCYLTEVAWCGEKSQSVLCHWRSSKGCVPQRDVAAKGDCIRERLRRSHSVTVGIKREADWHSLKRNWRKETSTGKKEATRFHSVLSLEITNKDSGENWEKCQRQLYTTSAVIQL